MNKIKILDVFGHTHFVDANRIKNRTAVYGVYKKKNDILMVKDFMSGKWEFPGGGVEYPENELDALNREIFEETGMSVVDTKLSKPFFSLFELFFDLNYQEAWKTNRKYFILNKLKGKIRNIKTNEVAEIRFFKKNSLIYPVSKTITQVFKKMVDL